MIVTDGFTGNVMLKLSEGLTDAMLSMIKRELTASAVTKAAQCWRSRFSKYQEASGLLGIWRRAAVGCQADRRDRTRKFKLASDSQRDPERERVFRESHERANRKGIEKRVREITADESQIVDLRSICVICGLIVVI